MIAAFPSLISPVAAQPHRVGTESTLPFALSPVDLSGRFVDSPPDGVSDEWKVARSLHRYWTGTGWDTTSRVTSRYDSAGRILEVVTETLEEGSWDTTRALYFYASTGYLIETLHQGWTGSTWSNFRRYLFTYDPAGNLVRQLWQNYSTAWDEDEEVLIYYDSTGFMTEYIWRQYGPSGWANAGRYTQAPDSNGYIGTAYYYYPTDSSWTYGETTHFSRKTDGELLEVVWENSGGFVRREGYTYDANDLLTEIVQQTWAGVWEDLFRFVYSYDAQMNLSRRLQQEWGGVGWLDSHDQLYEWSFLTTPVEAGDLPAGFALAANYPNPFNPGTTIDYSLSHPEMVTVKIYDALGREIAILVDQREAGGPHSVSWDARGYPSGVYYYRIVAGDFIRTRRMILLK
jgi:hypothetical protein